MSAKRSRVLARLHEVVFARGAGIGAAVATVRRELAARSLDAMCVGAWD
jgi:hypothetical protein